jgi:phage baseplate assembly protein W
MGTMTDIPHFKHPFSRTADGTGVEVVEQDSVDEVLSCEGVIVACPLGYFPAEPEFGWPFPEFRSQPLDDTALRAALARFEPRGNANVVQWRDAADAAVAHMRVNVSPAQPDEGGD